jgi:uncharacterized protein (TIGR02145 family)
MKHLLWIPIIVFAFIIGCKKESKTTTATITTTAVTNITSTSAQSGGDITSNGGSAIAKSGICFATHNNPTIADSITTDGGVSTGSFTSNLANLNANTTYYVRAYAANGSGTAYGNVDSFTSSKGVPTVTTTAITNNMALMAQTGGNITNDGGAAVTARGVVWSTSPHPTLNNFKIIDTSGKTSFINTLAGLDNTTYYVRSFATNSFGTGYGNEISFTVNSNNTITDIDGNAYPIVVIGTQTWMSSNLKVSHYLNGDPIVNGLATNFDWLGDINTNAATWPAQNIFVGAYTFPNGDTTTKTAFGLLYNNFAAEDARGLCPTGWHVPSETDWNVLAAYLGGTPEGADTLYMGGNSGVTNPYGFGDTIVAKLLPGGSSGLNLQFAGGLYIDLAGLSNSYNNFNKSGFYWGSSFEGQPNPAVEALVYCMLNFYFEIDKIGTQSQSCFA